MTTVSLHCTLSLDSAQLLALTQPARLSLQGTHVARLPFTSSEGGPALRLFNPFNEPQSAASGGSVPPSTPVLTLPAAPEPEPDSLDLEQAWQTLLKPELASKRSIVTLREYETHLRRWHEFCDSQVDEPSDQHPEGMPDSGGECRMHYPALAKITRADLLGFRGWLANHDDDFSNRTVNKHLGSLTAIGECAVLHEKIESFPKLPPLPAIKAGRKLHLSYDEADALKRACQVATWPHDLEFPAPLYWEALTVGYCVYGFRTQEQVKQISRMTSLTWENIRDDLETPHPDGKAQNDHGWICYTPQKQRGRKPEPLVLPIVAAYRRHLDAIRPLDPDPSDLVFPFPLSSRSFYPQWNAILEAAGVKPKAGLDGTRPEYQIKHLRKTATRWLNDHGSTIGMPGIGDHVTGHAADRSPDREVQSKVTQVHYDFAESRVLRALTTLPLPDSFAGPLWSGPRQQRLF